VQAQKVTRFSDWQEHFEKFEKEQIDLLQQAQNSSEKIVS